MLPLLILACTEDPPDTLPPPFDLDGAKALWAQNTNNNSAMGVLVISKEAECGDITEEYLFNDLDSELFKGEGLLFILQWQGWGSEQNAEDFTGLWMSTSNGANGYRALTTVAYSHGFIHLLDWGYSWYYGGGSTWLNVDSMDGPNGRFHTDWWEGEFEAEDCGTFDTGWDSWGDTFVIIDDTWWDSSWDSDECLEYTAATYIGIDSSLCEYPPDASDALWLECDSADWWMEVYTVGWTGGADWALHDGTGYSEVHPVQSWDYSDDGYWDNLYAELEIVDAANVSEGESTAFVCGDPMSWHLVVYEVDGEVEADCRVGGEDPESLGTDCEIWN